MFPETTSFGSISCVALKKNFIAHSANEMSTYYQSDKQSPSTRITGDFKETVTKHYMYIYIYKYI